MYANKHIVILRNIDTSLHSESKILIILLFVHIILSNKFYGDFNSF